MSAKEGPEESLMRRIIVTGGSGFIGTNLVDHFYFMLSVCLQTGSVLQRTFITPP